MSEEAATANPKKRKKKQEEEEEESESDLWSESSDDSDFVKKKNKKKTKVKKTRRKRTRKDKMEEVEEKEEIAVQVPRSDLFWIGSHLSISGGIHKLFERANAISATAIQCFTRSQLSWRAPKMFSEEVCQLFRKTRDQSGFEAKQIIAHANYLCNMCSNDHRIYDLTLETLQDELSRCSLLEIPTLVIHPGSDKDDILGKKKSREKISETIQRLLNNTPKTTTRIALETMAGQGSTLGAIDDLETIWKMVPRNLSDRVGICLDTCHCYAFGVDLKDEKVFGNLVQRLNNDCGGIFAVHANDSINGLGSKVDRHENIGNGKLGLIPFWRIFHSQNEDKRYHFEHIPIVLETPSCSLNEISLLHSLINSQFPSKSNSTTKTKKKTLEDFL